MPQSPGLMAISDKELLYIFDVLSKSPFTLDPGAVSLAQTCRRLNNLYRLDYVRAYVSDTPWVPNAVVGVLARYPRITSVELPINIWKHLVSLKAVPRRITKLRLNMSVPIGTVHRTDCEDLYLMNSGDFNAFSSIVPHIRHICVEFSNSSIVWNGSVNFAALLSLEVVEFHKLATDKPTVNKLLLQLPSLRALHLVQCSVRVDMEALPIGLEELRVGSSFIGDLDNDCLRQICALPHLRRLELYLNTDPLDWTALNPAASRLESLSLTVLLSDETDDGSCFTALTAMKNLKSLTLNTACSFYDEALCAAATLPKLQIVYLSSEFASEDGLIGIPFSRRGLIALSEGTARRSLKSLSFLLLLATGSDAGDILIAALKETCSQLFATKPGLSFVRIRCEEAHS